MKYNEIMEKIRVTPEMQDRVLKNINKAIDSKYSPYNVYFKVFASAAACALIVCGVLSVQSIIPNTDQTTTPPTLYSPYGSDSYSTVGELSKAVGFNVKTVNYMPFIVTETQYYNLGDNMAEINYINSNLSLTFRMAKEKGDISGNYKEFDNVKTSDNLTIKGNGNMYSLAVWTDNDYSYSIDLSQPVKEETIINIIKSVK